MVSFHLTRPVRARRGQAGLTLIEFMVAVVIGMLLVAALATLIANQSSNRTEIDRAGKLIENGRYALSTIASDVTMAGYWGELSDEPAAPGALPDPCSTTLSDLEAAMGLAVQGYNSPSTLPSGLSDCVKNHKPGTDILVVRRLDPDTSAIQTGGAIDLSKVTQGEVYVQTGLNGGDLEAIVGVGSSSIGTNTSTFKLTKRSGQVANVRKYLVHIYYVAKCSVEESGSCTGADGGTPIPTLKRVELTVDSNVAKMNCSACRVNLAEGIENMQLDYGLDSDNDGQPDGEDSTGDTFGVADWANVMSLKVYLLARSTEPTPGHVDTKTYALGKHGVTAAANDAYKRHVFVQSVRLVNPGMRRAS